MRETSPLNFQRTLLLLGRLALGVVFLYAAYAKLSPAGSKLFTVSSLRVSAGTLGISISFFAVQIDSFRLLPLWAVNAFAHTLPFLELLLGLLLLAGWQLRWVSGFTSLLLLGFFSVMVRTYAKGLEINCGCFGPGEALGVKTLLRDGLLAALAITTTFIAFRAKRGPHPWAAPLEDVPAK